MKGLCGWFSSRPLQSGVQSLERMLDAARAGGEPATKTSLPMAGLAAYGDALRPRLIEIDGFILAVSGHPHLTGTRGSATDIVAVAEALRAGGVETLATIGGDFVLAGWSPRTSHGLLAIDRIGMHQLVYAPLQDSIAFASTLDALCGHPEVDRRLSQQAIFDYLYYHVCPGLGTIYRDLHRLPPGHYIEFGASRHSEPRPYWSMRFREDDRSRFADLKTQFVRLLEGAVDDLAADSKCGAFLSGGTDSSTVSGMLGRVSGSPARTFSIGFDAAGYDEMDYARIAARHFGCEHHEYYVTPQDVVDAVPKIATFYDQPFGNASAIPAFYCARLAQQLGVERLLAGDGGDELFGGNERYAKQHVLGLYQRIPAALRSAIIEPLLISSPRLAAVPMLRKLQSYVAQARPPMPQRYESYNLLNYLGADNVLTPGFLASVDREHPRALLIEAHAPYAGCSMINQLLGIDLRFTLADNDLPKVTRMCELAGVDVAFPLLDERVVELSAALPATMKLRGTHLRWFFKEALRDFLPPQVISKTKHGFGLPVGPWLVSHKPLFDLATESIRSLRRHDIVQPQFVDDLLGRRLHEHPGYFGTMVWVLMMLGLWLQSRRL
jgi:asparagine synthase (glutamine-hydrolysing)